MRFHIFMFSATFTMPTLNLPVLVVYESRDTMSDNCGRVNTSK